MKLVKIMDQTNLKANKFLEDEQIYKYEAKEIHDILKGQ